MEKEEYKKSVLEYEDVQKAVRYAEKLGREEGRKEGRAEGLEEGREKGPAKGREEGLAEGREEGLAKGREEGLAKGREAGKRQLILNMLAKGFDPDLVAELSGLTESEVRAMAQVAGQ